MIYDGIKYRAVIGNIGATITRKSDGASVFMQGDDAVEVESQMDALDATAEKGYPVEPFQTYAHHVDAVLDAYDSVMRPARIPGICSKCGQGAEYCKCVSPDFA
jgi:hypothetical protein